MVILQRGSLLKIDIFHLLFWKPGKTLDRCDFNNQYADFMRKEILMLLNCVKQICNGWNWDIFLIVKCLHYVTELAYFNVPILA